MVRVRAGDRTRTRLAQRVWLDMFNSKIGVATNFELPARRGTTTVTSYLVYTSLVMHHTNSGG
jgi:hypothetical protein